MRSNYTKAADLRAINPGSMHRLTLQNQNILLANINGKIYAFDNQ